MGSPFRASSSARGIASAAGGGLGAGLTDMRVEDEARVLEEAECGVDPLPLFRMWLEAAVVVMVVLVVGVKAKAAEKAAGTEGGEGERLTVWQGRREGRRTRGELQGEKRRREKGEEGQEGWTLVGALVMYMKGRQYGKDQARIGG